MNDLDSPKIVPIAEINEYVRERASTDTRKTIPLRRYLYPTIMEKNEE